jgi:hypothetical protein
LCLFEYAVGVIFPVQIGKTNSTAKALFKQKKKKNSRAQTKQTIKDKDIL